MPLRSLENLGSDGEADEEEEQPTTLRYEPPANMSANQQVRMEHPNIICFIIFPPSVTVHECVCLPLYFLQ